MGSSSLAEVHITKLAAACRQLCAAIRMYCSGEDALAIHTVASAAYRIISDLKSNRGRDEVDDHYSLLAAGLFHFAQDYRRGTLPGSITDDHELMKLIRELAEKFGDAKYEDFSVKVSISHGAAREFWTKRNKVFNFLKHTSEDPGSHISMDEVDNLISFDVSASVLS